MNDLTMTVNGWVATDPKQHVGPSGVRLTSFRLASTSRYFDRERGEWVDGRTEWFSVRVFRAAAITVAESVRKGQPVTVHGRFRTLEWESDNGPRVDLQLDASSVGHDLTRGIATFSRATGDEALGADDADGPATEADGGDAEAEPDAESSSEAEGAEAEAELALSA